MFNCNKLKLRGMVCLSAKLNEPFFPVIINQSLTKEELKSLLSLYKAEREFQKISEIQEAA